MPYRCRSCRKHFSVRIGTVLSESHHFPAEMAARHHMLTSARKGIPSTQMAREPDITQKSAWFLAQRIRDELGCYVLDDGKRVLSSSSTTKAIANIERGSLQDYIFAIPGTQWIAIGITTEQFELVCRGYVQALYEGASLTERHREIAIRCAIPAAALTRTGRDALVDEAMGYQYERAEDALQLKLRAFIADELRAWEKTFPDELWEEFGRLTNWAIPLQTRPKWPGATARGRCSLPCSPNRPRTDRQGLRLSYTRSVEAS